MWIKTEEQIINLNLIYQIEKYDWNFGADISYRIIFRSSVSSDGEPTEIHVKYKNEKQRDEVFEAVYQFIDANDVIRRFSGTKKDLTVQSI